MGAIFKIAPNVAASAFGRDAISFILPTSPWLKKGCGKELSGKTKFIKRMGRCLKLVLISGEIFR